METWSPWTLGCPTWPAVATTHKQMWLGPQRWLQGSMGKTPHLRADTALLAHVWGLGFLEGSHYSIN